MKQKEEDNKKFQAPPPPILVWDGQQDWQKPRQEVRYFHKRKVDGWSLRTVAKNGVITNG